MADHCAAHLGSRMVGYRAIGHHGDAARKQRRPVGILHSVHHAVGLLSLLRHSLHSVASKREGIRAHWHSRITWTINEAGAAMASAVSYDLETMKNMELVNLDEKAFAKAYQDAFWTVGGEKIVFDYIGKKVVFGLRLTEKDAKTVMSR